MFTNKNTKKDSLKGFTLIEVLIAIAIIGILAGIGMFQVYDAKQKAKNAAIAVEINSLRLAEELIYSERDSYIDPALAQADASSDVERDIKRAWDHIAVLSGGKQESAVFDASGNKQSSADSTTSASENLNPEESTDENKEADKEADKDSKDSKDSKEKKENKIQRNASWAIAVKLPSYTTGSGYYASAENQCEFSWPKDNGPVDFSLAKTCNAVPRENVLPVIPSFSVPTITSFIANPTSISAGRSSVLSWSVTGATSLSINQGIGTVTGTSKSVSPTITTIYTLTATNASGSVTSSVKVTVSAPVVAPTPSFPGSKPTGNGITIQDTSGTTQTNRPFTISRVFKQGEIQNFPQARVNGNPVLTQADIKSRWPDNSVKHVMVSFVASVPAGNPLDVDFINQSFGNNSGGMTKAEMLAYDEGNWNGEIQTSIGSASARAMLTDWSGTDTGLNGQGVRYWLKGPIVTQVIVEDKTPSLRYDFGSNSYKSLHPIFVLTFYPGTDLGVKIEYILENMWTTKLQDQNYSLALKTGSTASESVYNKDTFTHIAQTRWHKTFWSGQKPQGWTDVGHPGITINYNFPYITSTYVLPNFDQSFEVEKSLTSSIIRRFVASDRGDINGKSLWSSKFFGHIDDHTEATEVPLRYAMYLYTFDPELYAVLLGDADAAAHVPVHLRESASGKFFDSSRSISAFGLPLSVNARPKFKFVNDDGGNLSDKIDSVGIVTRAGWSPEAAHQPSFAYVPYMITGDWYYLEEINFWSAYNLALSRPFNRHDDWGIFNGIQIRGEARAFRTLGHSAFISPDTSHEKAYFTEKLFNNIAIREGAQNIKDGAFYEPCSSNPYNDATEKSKWCWGRNNPTLGAGIANPLNFIGGGDGFSSESLKEGSSGYLGDKLEISKISSAAHTWKLNFYQITFSHLTELGFPIRKLRDTIILNVLGQLQHPDYNPNLIEFGRIPILRSDGAYFDNWAAVKDAFADSIENTTTMSPGNAYNVEARVAASFLPGINDGNLSGQAAWDFISSRTSVRKFPNWAWLPR